MDHNESDRKAEELGLSQLAAEYSGEFKRVLDDAANPSIQVANVCIPSQ